MNRIIKNYISGLMLLAVFSLFLSQAVLAEDGGEQQSRYYYFMRPSELSDTGFVEECIELAQSPGQMFEGTVSNSAVALEADSDNTVGIIMSGRNNRIDITEPGTYAVSGDCRNGSISVKAKTDGVILVLRDLSLTGMYTPVLEIGKNASVKIVIDGTVVLTDDEDAVAAGAAVKIKGGAQVCLTGSGNLTVNGNSKNGISASGNSSLVIDGATMKINAVNDAINSDYDVAIHAGNISISVKGDAIHANRVLTLGTENGEGPNLQIAECDEGLEAFAVNLFSGNIGINAADDGINATYRNAMYGNITFCGFTMTGGAVRINCGGDGIDSNGNISLIGGFAEIITTREIKAGEAGIDYDGQLYISDDFELSNLSGFVGY